MKRSIFVLVPLSLLIGAAFSSPVATAEPLPGTAPLVMPEDLVAEHLQQVTGYFLRRIDQSREIRDRQWRPDFGSPAGYERSLAAHRENLRKMLGLDDQPRTAGPAERETLAEDGAVERLLAPIAEGLSARGLLFLPKETQPCPLVVVCPDADTWPEQFTAIDGSRPADWLTRLLARGAAVYVPQSVERLEDHPYCQTTNKKDRRKILYRLGYVVGRTMPGLDVQDVLAAVEHLAGRPEIDAGKIALVGIGQGGMTAMYTAALDRRIAAVAVAGYFEDRRRCWQEPVDRRLPGQLLQFGDAEVSALIAPRPMVILHGAGTPAADTVAAEAERAARFYRGLGMDGRLAVLCVPEPNDLVAAAVSQAAELLDLPSPSAPADLADLSVPADAATAQRDRHFEERLAYVRRLIDASEQVREQRWNITGRPAAEFPQIKTAMLEEYRKLVGSIPVGETPIRPRTERVLSAEKYDGYRVLLDVTDGVEVFGHLLVPRDIRGRAAAVICQHGLSGRPGMITGMDHIGDTPYHEYGRHLAEHGYVVFAPLIMHQYPVEQINDQARQADAVGMMRVAMVVAKTQRVVEFLQSLSWVDPQRIGYYGLSYGGYSAVWCSPLIESLAATVNSGHFNDWRSKITSDATPTSYLRHPDDDFYNWDVLQRFTHVELTAMIAPRPVCVEFAQRDGITSPEWTAYAWARVTAIRDHLGLEDRIVLAHFDGVHEVHGIGAFDFLDRFLRPERPVGRDHAKGSAFITRNIDPASRISGECWISAGAEHFCGMAIMLSRAGDPGPLEARFGTAPGRDDLGVARLEAGGVSDAPELHELRVEPKPVREGQTVYFSIDAERGPAGFYVAYGPKPIGGTYWADRFPLAYGVLTDVSGHPSPCGGKSPLPRP